MNIGLQVKCRLFLPEFNKPQFYRRIFDRSPPNIKFHENPSSGSRVVPCGQTDRKKLIVAFRIFCGRAWKCNLKLEAPKLFIIKRAVDESESRLAVIKPLNACLKPRTVRTWLVTGCRDWCRGWQSCWLRLVWLCVNFKTKSYLQCCVKYSTVGGTGSSGVPW